jgi:hypothetical protein
MENEEIVESIPTETMESDDDFFSEIDNEVIAEEIGDEKNESEEETNETQIPTEAKEDTPKDTEVDLSPLLKALSGKIKYNKEEVNVESIEDLINGYQKGLNYDKKLQELENLQNSKLELYAKSKAEQLGITVDEYMDRVEKYEEAQKRQQEEDELEQLISNGMPDTLARELIALRQTRHDFQKEINDLKQEKELARQEEEKNKEYQDFLDNFPDVNPKDIPKEVFEEAEKSSLSNAYMKWKIKELETKLSIEKQNKKNEGSTVSSVTDTGTTNEKHEIDLFLEGFNE